MESKKIILFTMSVGMVIFGYIPSLWGESSFSVTSVLFSGVGGALGIWIGWKLSR